ncbi:MAG: alanine--glyoxylate aminotransferase family protein [Vampirovibrionales bacterium]
MSHLLMTPGPTPLSQEVLEAIARPALSHRSEAYKAIGRRVFSGLQWAFQTTHPVLVLTCGATGAIEACLRNTCNPGDSVLTLANGFFSERWGRMASLLGYNTTTLTVNDGEIHSLKAFKQALLKKPYKAVVITHNETSTGAMCELQPMLEVCQQNGVLSIVDAVTTVGVSPLPMDEWGADIVVGASQKGFMATPGMTFVAVGPKGWEAFKQVSYPGVAFNFEIYRDFQSKDMPPFTPATHTFYALDVSLQTMQLEGLEAIHQRHRRLKLTVRKTLSRLGCPLLVPEVSHTGDAVTVAFPPDGWTSVTLREALLKRYGIELANGAGQFHDKTFRIGHIGTQQDTAVNTTLAALSDLLGGSPFNPK